MNVPTMTIGETEQDNELMKLRKENEELKARCAVSEEKLMRLNTEIDNIRERVYYMRGRIDGLEFSIRCNGVSGDEVSK